MNCREWRAASPVNQKSELRNDFVSQHNIAQHDCLAVCTKGVTLVSHWFPILFVNQLTPTSPGAMRPLTQITIQSVFICVSMSSSGTVSQSRKKVSSTDETLWCGLSWWSIEWCMTQWDSRDVSSQALPAPHCQGGSKLIKNSFSGSWLINLTSYLWRCGNMWGLADKNYLN